MDTHSTNFGYLCNNILNFLVNMRNVIFSRLMLAICLLFFSCVTVTKNNFTLIPQHYYKYNFLST